MNAAVIISSFLSGLLCAMGFGGGSVLIIYLTNFCTFEQKEAQGINLIFFLLTGVFGLFNNIRHKLVNKKAFLNFVIFGLAGIGAGFILLPMIPSAMLKKLFGGALLLLGIKNFFQKNDNTMSTPKGDSS